MTVEQVIQLASAGFNIAQITQLAQVQASQVQARPMAGQVQTQPVQASQPMAGQVQTQPVQASQPMAGQVQASQPMAGQVQTSQPMAGPVDMAVESPVGNQFSLGVGGSAGNLEIVSQLLGAVQAQNRNMAGSAGQNTPTLDDVTSVIINGTVADATGAKKEV